MSIYLDHAATTPMLESAIKAMSQAQRSIGNASSLHTDGRATRKRVEDARELLAREIGCAPSEIIFTGSGTEADNVAIKGLFWNSDRNVIVVSAIEHQAVLDPARWLAEHEGAEVIEIPVTSQGVIDLEFLGRLIHDRGDEIALISVMHSNNETGVLQPIADVVALAGDIPVHSDAIQSFTKVPFNFKDLGLYAASISAHKVGGPLGVGALILRRGVDLPALLHGGGQEREIRSGTLNAPGIVGFAAAVQERAYNSIVVEQLRKEFERGILQAYPEAYINGGFVDRLPGIVNVTLPGTQSDSMLLLMDGQDISCSTGAA